MCKFVLYYSHNSLPIEMEEYFQHELLAAVGDIPIISVIKEGRTEFSASFASENIKIENRPNNWNSILYQMQVGIDKIRQLHDDPIVYLAEHDVLYPSSYFKNIPDNSTTFLKNRNLFFVNREGFIGPHNTHIHSQTIGRASLFAHCILEDVENKWKFKTQKNYKLLLFDNIDASLDIRHGYNYTGYRKNKKFLTDIPYWGNFKNIIDKVPHFKYS